MSATDKNMFRLALALWVFAALAYQYGAEIEPTPVPVIPKKTKRAQKPVRRKELVIRQRAFRTLEDFKRSGEISNDARIIDSNGVVLLGDER